MHSPHAGTYSYSSDTVSFISTDNHPSISKLSMNMNMIVTIVHSPQVHIVIQVAQY